MTPTQSIEPSPNARALTVGQLRARLQEVHAPDDATVILEDDTGRAFTLGFVHPPAWPSGGGSPVVDMELENR